MIPLIPYIERENINGLEKSSFLKFLTRISLEERAEVVKLATPLIKGTDKDNHQDLFDAIIDIPEGRRVQVLTLVERCLRGDDDFVESFQEVILQIVSIPVQERRQVVGEVRSLLGCFPNTSEYTSVLGAVIDKTPENIREAFAVAPPLLDRAESNQDRADIITFLIKAPVYQATPEETEEFDRATAIPLELIEQITTLQQREEFVRARVTPLELIKQTTTLQQRQELVRQVAPLLSQAGNYSNANFGLITRIPFEQREKLLLAVKSLIDQMPQDEKLGEAAYRMINFLGAVKTHSELPIQAIGAIHPTERASVLSLVNNLLVFTEKIKDGYALAEIFHAISAVPPLEREALIKSVKDLIKFEREKISIGMICRIIEALQGVPEADRNFIVRILKELANGLEGQNLWVDTLLVLSAVKAINRRDFIEVLKAKTELRDRQLIIGLASFIQHHLGDENRTGLSKRS